MLNPFNEQQTAGSYTLDILQSEVHETVLPKWSIYFRPNYKLNATVALLALLSIWFKTVLISFLLEFLCFTTL